MLICPNCNKEQEDGAKFCDSCGAQIFETVFCPSCGAKTSSEFDYCEHCGTSIKEDVIVQTTEGVNLEEQEKETNKTKSVPKKPLFFGAIAVVLIVVIVGVIKLFSSQASSNYCLYVKDGEIVYDNFTKQYELSSNLLDNDSDDDSQKLDIFNGAAVSIYVRTSKDGKYIFYPDRMDELYSDNGITLFCHDVSKEKEEAIKIDSEIKQYETISEGNEVIYIKGSEGGLYIHNLKDKEKIASEVTDFYVADTDNKIGFLNEDGSFYIYTKGSDKEKIVSDVEEINYVSENLDLIFYTKNGGLYKQIIGENENEKIASDIYEVSKVYDSGEVYYLKKDVEELKLSDYVIDDIAEADAVVVKPEYPDYPSSPRYPLRRDYDTNEAYEEAIAQYDAEYEEYQKECDEIREDYDKAYDAYLAKMSRDTLRNTIKDSTFEETVYTLYYYDGKESSIVTDACACTLESSKLEPVISYKEYNQTEISKVKMSEIKSKYEVVDLVKASMYSSNEVKVAFGNQAVVLEQNDAVYYNFTNDGKYIYFVDDVSDGSYGDLYKAAISDGNVQKPELVDSDVYVAACSIQEFNNIFVYFKNFDESKRRGDLYIEGEEVDNEVSFYTNFRQDGSVYYYSEWNEDKHYGTLKIYKDGKSTKISDDVSSYSYFTSDENLLYLYDYSLKSYRGTLYTYKNGKSNKISDDVSFIIRARE